MMRLLPSFPCLTVLYILASLNLVAGDNSYAVRTLLNHGYTLPTNETCSSSEWNSIKTAMDNAASRRRGLRQRDLQATSYFCSIVCQFYAPGTCYLVYPACRNRRNLSEENQQDVVQEEGAVSTTSNIEQQRELAEKNTRGLVVNNSICQMKIGAINTALDDLMPKLSSDCQAVVGSSRDFECYEVHIISGWNLWDADSGTIAIPSFPELGSVCRKLNFNIEAIIPADLTTITFVTFVLKYPNGYSKLHVEKESKWFLFGNKGNNVFGQNLSIPGTYTVTATPNGDSTMERSLSFTVVDC